MQEKTRKHHKFVGRQNWLKKNSLKKKKEESDFFLFFLLFILHRSQPYKRYLVFKKNTKYYSLWWFAMQRLKFQSNFDKLSVTLITNYVFFASQNLVYRIDSWLSFLFSFFCYEKNWEEKFVVGRKKRPLLFKSENIVDIFFPLTIALLKIKSG